MGKKAKEHRKKVQARKQKLIAERKKFGKYLQSMVDAQANAQVRSAEAPSQNIVYASTGDFIAKNYEFIQKDPSTNKVAEFLAENSGVSFSSND